MVTVEADTHQEGKTPDSRLLEPVVPSEVLSSSFSSAMDCWVNVVSSVDHLASDASTCLTASCQCLAVTSRT